MTMTAAEQLSANLRKSTELMNLLQAKLGEYRALNGTTHVTDWGYAGDVCHINRQLAQILGLDESEAYVTK